MPLLIVRRVFLILSLYCLRTVLAAQSQSATDPAEAMRESLQKQRASLDKQVESLHEQLGKNAELPDTGIEFLSILQPLAIADCAPLPASDVAALVAAASKSTVLQPELLRAVMKQESGFKPCAVSVKGAQGLMQLMPATAAQFHVADAFDPQQNVQAGAAFLKQLLSKYGGDLRQALIAYNAGAVHADQKDTQAIPVETQGYLAHIFAELGVQRIQGATAQPAGIMTPQHEPSPIVANPLPVQ